MKTLVVAATFPEVSGLCEHFRLTEHKLMHAQNFDVLITGVGMTATAFALGSTLNPSYSLVLNLGIAGTYQRDIALGTLVQVTQDIFSELGAESPSGFLTIETLGFGKSRFQEINNSEQHFQTNLKQVNGITVNRVHGTKESIKSTRERLNPDTESMEGAAVFYACEQTGTPCLQIRSISNYVEERDTASWEIGKSIRNLNAWAIRFLTIT